ncbi:MFS general substrate transporter [Hypoxylon crocopeplum]|nr:MFS general substrate transporter [Hypoxylon crocopeplum]
MRTSLRLSFKMNRAEQADDDEITATERTPLVGASGASDPPETPTSAWKPGHSRSSTLASIASASIAVPRAYKPGAVVGLFFVIVIVASVAGAFQHIPMTRIFEDILCHEYYDKTASLDEPIDETLCKEDEIQSKLAYLFAVLEASNAAISCLVALLWGIVADRIGRKPVYAASSVGMILNLLIIMVVGWFSDALPTRLVWIASLAHLCGGQPVMNACIYSIISDVVPESNRSISFMRIHITSMVGNLIAPALSSTMMSSTGPWPVMLFTLILWIIATAMIVLIPETFQRSPASDDTEPQQATLKTRALRAIGQLKDSLSIARIPSVALILCICFLSLPVLMCTFQFMVQFISKRYRIPLAETGYIQSIYGIAHIVVVLIIVPSVSNLVVRPELPGWLRITDDNLRDLVLVRWSYAAYIVGTFILGMSPTLSLFVAGLIFMSLGSASASFIKSIAASHVDAEHRSRLFTIMALLEMASNIWTTPALAGLFTLGMRLGGEWIGLPYFGVSFSCLAMLALALFVGVPTTNVNDEES